jgi:hypothetical protein
VNVWAAFFAGYIAGMVTLTLSYIFYASKHDKYDDER